MQLELVKGIYGGSKKSLFLLLFLQMTVNTYNVAFIISINKVFSHGIQTFVTSLKNCQLQFLYFYLTIKLTEQVQQDVWKDLLPILTHPSSRIPVLHRKH